MSVTQAILGFLCVLFLVMTFLTFSPEDSRSFWIYWFTAFVFVFFGYLIDVIFGAELSFVFDPNPENWRRKTDPQR
ncbi:hypothetical protein B484DRAFT_365550 [Ochromonadaceae sp. CCMP2298]|nr:hypothetical protein B484DRAFT_365550 [Ochromonadaceae sp. CCMP2298]